MKKESLRVGNIEPEREARRIIDFIKMAKKKLGKDGAVIGLSGGLNSSVCAILLKKSLEDKILGLILPERDSNPKNVEDAKSFAAELKINTKIIELTPFFKQMGVYELFDKRLSQDRESVEKLLKRLQRFLNQPSLFGFGLSAFFKQKFLGRGLVMKYVKKATALATVKTRLRMVFIYYYARLMNYFVCGTTDRTEWSIGFYDGDAVCDVQPILHLYKTQVRQLAWHLGLSEDILNKPSSGDLFGMGVPNEAFIGLNYDDLDTILTGVEKGYSADEIKRMTGFKKRTVEAVFKMVEGDRIRKAQPLSFLKIAGDFSSYDKLSPEFYMENGVN